MKPPTNTFAAQHADSTSDHVLDRKWLHADLDAALAHGVHKLGAKLGLVHGASLLGDSKCCFLCCDTETESVALQNQLAVSCLLPMGNHEETAVFNSAVECLPAGRRVSPEVARPAVAPAPSPLGGPGAAAGQTSVSGNSLKAFSPVGVTQRSW